MYQKIDSPIDVYNKIDNRISMANLVGSYYDRCSFWGRMDRMSGTTVKDWAFKGHDGTISGASWFTNGKFNHCLDFDGINDYVDLNFKPLSGSGKFTVEAWVLSDTVNANEFRCFITTMSDNGNRDGLIIGWDNKYVPGWLFETFQSNSAFGLVYGILPLPTPGVWYHVVGTYNGTGNGSIKLYINGILRGIDTTAKFASHDFNIRLGYTYYATANPAVKPWDGKLDEVRIYNGRVLEANEIRKRYEIGRN